MKAMILAAGLGTRLKPLTENMPKALVSLHGKPLLQHQIEKLRAWGIEEIVINVHHFAGQVENFLKSRHYFNMPIHISDERAGLLNTGGALKKVMEYFDQEPFLVHNVDVVTDIDLDAFWDFHRSRDAMATVAVRNRQSNRGLLFDDQQRLVGWKNEKSGEVKVVHPNNDTQFLPFSCVQIVDPAIAKFMPDEDVFSSIDLYLCAAKELAVFGFRDDEFKWIDVGTPEKLEKAAGLFPELG